jgi:serine/threonine-protein kinase HipA
VNREALVTGLKEMVPALQEIAQDGESIGLDPDVLQHLRLGILAQAQQLAALK